jgi:uncharacterized membrane protein (DUF106 family)
VLEWWDKLCNVVFDAALGWLLGLSWTATVAVVATATGVILALVRKIATNQDLLRRAAEDKKTLSALIRQAKKARDKDALHRHRTTKSMIAMRTFSQEGLPLLLAVLPIAMLATWCFNRLGYHPPEAGEKVEVVFYAPVSAAGEVMHLMPTPGVAADRWVQPITLAKVRGQDIGLARWQVVADARPQPHQLTFRFHGRTFEHDLLVGQRTYSAPLKVSETGDLGAELRLREARLLGIVPGLGAALPPWLVAYLLLVIPLAVVVKRVLRVY